MSVKSCFVVFLLFAGLADRWKEMKIALRCNDNTQLYLYLATKQMSLFRAPQHSYASDH